MLVFFSFFSFSGNRCLMSFVTILNEKIDPIVVLYLYFRSISLCVCVVFTGSSAASVSLSASSSSSTTVLGATNAAQLLPHYDVREVTALVEKLLREVVVHEQSPVLQLFSKRLYRVLMRACLGQPYMHKLASYSLQSKAQERNLARMVDLGTKLCAHTVAVHGGIYREVLRTLAGKLLPLVASNDHNTARDATESSGASHGNHHSSG